MSTDAPTSTLGNWLLTAALAALLTAPGAQAQTPARKDIAVEATGNGVSLVQPLWSASQPTDGASSSAFVVFGRWVEQVQPAPPTPVWQAGASNYNAVQMPAPMGGQRYEPAPVILGQPDLPLLGHAGSSNWGADLNYQGVSLSLLVLDPRQGRYELRSMSQGVAVGELFKIRYTASFESVAVLDRIAIHPEDAWISFRNGQAWPASGQSVHANAGETVELPLGEGQYFAMQPGLLDGMALSIRHPQAKGERGSDQPSYRQDGPRSSQYLQLVPAGQLPAIEQLIAPR